jgi:hypothetical protein
MPVSVAEVRRLIHAQYEPEPMRQHRLRWSRFRRQHHAQARVSHMQRRARQAPPVASHLPAPIRLSGLPALTDALWERLCPLLPPQKPEKGRPSSTHRLLVEGMLWVAGTGASWRSLPARFGSWSTVAGRYQRWRKTGLWTQIVQVLQGQEFPLSSASGP